jgi:hypothetical protein
MPTGSTGCADLPQNPHSTVTLFARFRGLSTSQPRRMAVGWLGLAKHDQTGVTIDRVVECLAISWVMLHKNQPPGRDDYG